METTENPTSAENSESGIRAKRNAALYIAGAIGALVFVVLILGWPTVWFDYISSIVMIVLAGTWAFQGIRLLTQARASTQSVSPRE
jgi:Flp pilus assembly protein TadB